MFSCGNPNNNILHEVPY